MDFLWHTVSEKEKEEIKKQAKSIMESFSKKLEKISDKISEPIIERDECEREERKGKVIAPLGVPQGGARPQNTECRGKIDRKIMFENAPNKNDTLKGTSDFIIAEKGGW